MILAWHFFRTLYIPKSNFKQCKNCILYTRFCWTLFPPLIWRAFPIIPTFRLLDSKMGLMQKGLCSPVHSDYCLVFSNSSYPIPLASLPPSEGTHFAIYTDLDSLSDLGKVGGADLPGHIRIDLIRESDFTFLPFPRLFQWQIFAKKGLKMLMSKCAPDMVSLAQIPVQPTLKQIHRIR